MGRIFKIYDEALDGFAQAEWMVTGTIFFIGLGLSTLGMALTEQGWLIGEQLKKDAGGDFGMAMIMADAYMEGLGGYIVKRKRRPSPHYLLLQLR